MGIYDRDYYRSERPGIHINAPRTVVTYLILVNVLLWLADSLLTPDTNAITGTLAAKTHSLVQPWLWWQFVTYGFVHSSQLGHILFNMLGLFFFGREVERLYGPKEFLRLYFVVLVAGSVIWAVVTWLTGDPGVLLGASGAVVAVVILFAINFPRVTVLFMFIVPMPAWVLGVLLVAIDLHGAIFNADSGVAYIVHLTGAAVAIAYHRFRLNFGRWIPDHWFLDRLRSRPKLQIHNPLHEERSLSEEVDRILAKISREGEDSLTRKERHTLETASRQYQKRRHGGDD